MSSRILSGSKIKGIKINSTNKWTKHLDRQSALRKQSNGSFLSTEREYVPLPRSTSTGRPPCTQRCRLRNSSSSNVERQSFALVPLGFRSTTDMPKPRGRGAEEPSDWAKTGGFVNKPVQGWLHPDWLIVETGIPYQVRYVGCLEINTSMKILNYDTRSLVAKECITRVCEAAGLKTADRKRKVDRKVARMLSERPNMEHAGENIHLIITSAHLKLCVMESNKLIAVHEMPNISFASGGDADTLDFVAYVAKNATGNRACYVLECGGKCAQDVITTIGQAFELRFKEYVQNNVRHNEIARKENSRVGRHAIMLPDDPEYYNDLPGKIPPDATSMPPPDYYVAVSDSKEALCSVPVPQSANNSFHSKDPSPNLIDLNSEPASPNTHLRKPCHEYANDAICNAATLPLGSASLLDSYSPRELAFKDPFDMQPFEASLPPANLGPMQRQSKILTPSNMLKQLEQEQWYHGAISRKDAEFLMRNDGEFLVRESQGSPGQYVLTGMQSGLIKHLLLVDPEGVVRTKDKTFESVSHLVNYHQNNGLPIISAESALILRNPVPKLR